MIKIIKNRLFIHTVLLILFFLPFSALYSLDTSELTVSMAPGTIRWNPHYAYTTAEAQIFTALYEGLVTVHPATLKPVPGAAESWTISEDGKIYTFKIRKNARWSNGEDLTAQDFRQSWLEILNPETGAEYASLLDDISGAREYRTGKISAEKVGIKALDRHTLQVTLNRPSPQFLPILCHYSFTPVYKDFLKVKDWSAIRSVPVNGPFKIKARNSGEIILEKNQEYWDSKSVETEQIKIILSDKSDSIMELFNRGRIDWIISGMNASGLADNNALVISPLFSTTYYYFNTKGKIWSDWRIRRALSLLVPWEQIKKNKLTPADTLVPGIPGYPAASSGYPAPDEREKEAYKLLEEAGFPKGKGLPEPVILVPDPGDETAAAMKNAWKEKLSLECIVNTASFPGYYEAVKEGKCDIATLTWTGDYADPFTFLGMWESSSSLNSAGFTDKKYDQLLEESALMPLKERYGTLKEAEDILLFTCEVMPVEHFPAVNIIDRRFIDGWYPNALDLHPFKYLKLKRGYKIPGLADKADSNCTQSG